MTRTAVVAALAVLTCLGLLATTLAMWVHASLLDTDHWVATVGPLAEDPAVTAAASGYLADQAVVALDLEQRVSALLPGPLQRLAPVLTASTRDFMRDGVDNALGTQAFQYAWVAFNRTLHQQLVATLRGQTTAVTITDDSLRIDAVPLIGAAIGWLQQQWPELGQLFSPPVGLSGGEDPTLARLLLSQAVSRVLQPDFGQVVVLRSPALGTAARAVSILDTLVWVLPLFTVLAVAGCLTLARDRWRTLVWLGAGVAITFLVTQLAIEQLPDAVVASAADRTARGAAAAIAAALLRDLVTACWVLVVVGLAVAGAALYAASRQRRHAPV